MFYTLIKHGFDQSERAQGPIYIIKADKPLGMMAEHVHEKNLKITSRRSRVVY